MTKENILFILIVLLNCSCNKDSKLNYEVSEKHRSVNILTGQINGFDIEKFSENPFDEDIKVPSYLSKDLSFFDEGDYSLFIRSEKTIISPNGNYVAFVFVGPIYSVQFSSIGASGDTRKMLRTNIRIENNKAKLKYGISIGQKIKDVLNIFPKDYIGEYYENEKHYYYVIGEELKINFEEIKGKLSAIEIIVGL